MVLSTPSGMGAQYRPLTQPFSCAATESAIIPITLVVVIAILIIYTWGSATPLSTMHRVTSLILQDIATLKQLFMVMEIPTLNQLGLVTESMG